MRQAAKPVTRAEVAARAEVSVEVAAFHLEQLVEHGWLEPTYERAEGGGRAGRPAKRYRPAPVDLEVTIFAAPLRAASILATAIAEGEGEPVAERIGEAARRRGLALAATHDRSGGPAPDPLALLAALGYEPREHGGRVVLRNCPFHRAGQDTPGVVCAMNSAFVRGMLDGARARGHAAVLDRQPGRCCVVLEPLSRATGSGRT